MAIPQGTIGFPQLSAKPSPPPVGSVILYTRSDGNLYLQDSSGTEFEFGSVDFISSLTGDVTAVGPGSATATVNSVGGQSAIDIASATTAYLAATSSNTPSTLVLRNSSGNFSAGTITAALNGNANTATSAGSATTAINFTGSLSGDVTGTQSATVVSFVNGFTAAQVGASVNETEAATSSNIASTLVLRDASGNFNANIITSTLNGNATTATNATTAINFTGSLSGDVTGTQSTTTISSTTVTGKLLTGYTTGTNTPIIATNSILTAFENLQAQISGTSASAITQLTGDVIAIGPGSVVSAIAAIQGTAVSGTTGTTNVVFSNSPTFTGVLNGSSAIFSSTISASNFSGNSSGTNTGDVTLTNSNSIDLAFSSGQTGLQANLNLSAAGPDAGYIPGLSTIKSDGLLVEILSGTPVQIGTSNNIGSAPSAARSDHVHAITSAVVTGLLLTGYTTGTNTPIIATNSILTAFENLQAQISGTSGSAITSLSGDVIASGPGTSSATVVALQGSAISSTSPTDAQILIWVNSTNKWTPTSISGDATISDVGLFTLATVNSDVGSFGSSTSIPSFAVNSKGLIISASGNAVVAPAGTLTGTTLNATVVSSSLTSVGTITTGVWNGTALAAPYMLPLLNNEIYVGNGSNQPTAVAMSGDVSIVSSGATTISSTTVTGKLLTGYTTGTNTPIIATNSILTAFENLQAQISGTSGSAITGLTGQIIASGPGNVSATIAINTVTNSNLAQMPADTLKGNVTGSTANATDLTVSQVNTMLGTVTVIGTIDTNANSNGLFISGNTLSTQSASASNPGMVNNTTQTMSGNKTFSGQTGISNTSTTALVINSSAFVFDATNNALGIGIQPSSISFIDAVNSSAASKTLQLTGYGIGSTVGTRGRFARGTLIAPTAAQTGDTINFWSARGYGASQFATASTAAINAIAGENFTNTSNLTYLAFNTTPTASVTSAESFRIASTGVTLGPQASSTAIHQINGGLYRTNKTITATYSVDTTTTDDIIFCNQSAAITITLPPPTNGRSILIKDISGNAETNQITIARHASEKIEGLSVNRILYTNFGSWTFTADSTGNWWMI